MCSSSLEALPSPSGDKRSGSARTRLGALAAALAVFATSAEARTLRVCADPNNLPFSNDRGEGFENRIVEILAKELDAEVSYTWWAQRRGFLRNTLEAGRCDLVPGIPAGTEGLGTTAPYYRSIYVFVTRADGPPVRSFEDAALRQQTVGVQLVGDNGMNTPPAHALARRGIVENVRGFTLYGDYATPNPPARIVEAVASGEIDIAVAWGPLGGYFAGRAATPLRVAPVEPETDGPGLPMAFEIAMGVRPDDENLRRELDAALSRRRAEIEAVLADYGVPRAERDRSSVSLGR